MLSVKFDCPVARQNGSLFATVYDCETGFPLGAGPLNTGSTMCRKGKLLKLSIVQ